MDIALTQSDAGEFDLVTIGDGLAIDETQTTPVIVSLYADARADADENDGDENGGFWADSFAPGIDTGSKLWLLKRAGRTAETLRRAEEYASEALQWLIVDGEAESLEISASYSGEKLRLDVEITAPRLAVSETMLIPAGIRRFIGGGLLVQNADGSYNLSFTW